MTGRWRVQLLASIIRLTMRAPDGSKPILTNEECLAIADAELTSMMATDALLQAQADEEVARAVQEDRLLEHRKRNVV